MQTKSTYGQNWDEFYQSTYGENQRKALWDVSSEQAVALDHKLFAPFFDPTLTVIDLGCGTGTQSAFLSKHFADVWAIDASEIAISIARKSNQGTGIRFDTIDLTQPIPKYSISSKPSNIYMRGVLHQIKDLDLSIFQDNLQILLGRSGKMFAVEVSNSIHQHFNESQGFRKLPKRLQQAFTSSLPPRGLSLDQLNKFFPIEIFNVIQAEESFLDTNLQFIDGTPIKIPSISILLETVPKKSSGMRLGSNLFH